MEKNEYFRLMREASDIADKIILETIKSRYNSSLYSLVSELPIKRAQSGRPKSRPAILRFSYELAGGENWMEVKNAIAAIEMMNLSTYILNYFLDDKGGEKPIKQRKNECIASMILRELAQELILTVADKVSNKIFIKIDKKFSEINQFTSGIGQWIDGNMLREVDDEYMNVYIERCKGLTGTFMQNVASIGGLLAEAPENEISKLGSFGLNYGIIIQMINDLGDFLPFKIAKQSVGKVYQDQYSDLKHGCITFPAYYLICNGTEKDKEIILSVKGNLEAKEQDCLDITSSIMRLGILSAIKSELKPFAEKAKSNLHTFPKSIARDFLSTSLSIYRTNKFSTHLRGLTY